jgi:hypothetical protein
MTHLRLERFAINLFTLGVLVPEHDLIHTEVLLTLHNQKVKNQILC